MKIQRTILQHKNQITLTNGLLILVALSSRFLFHSPNGYLWGMALASVIGILPIFLQAYQALRVKVISIDLLVTIAVISAFLIGEYNESAIVTFLFLFGGWLEQKTLAKTRSAIQGLTELTPVTANRLENGQVKEIAIEAVQPGDELLIKTGGKIPVDGQIISGQGHLDEASITGEARLLNKGIGQKVFAGTILENGTLTITAEKVGEDTTFAKIIELVEEAQDSKSQAERFIDRFATYYTPLVLLIAIVVGLITRDLELATTLLVLGCPGALVIGVPVSNVAGIGNGAKNGVLVKGGEVMERFSQVDTFVFDKTGTLTTGKPAVAKMQRYTADPMIDQLIASVESNSDHPLAQAILHYLAVDQLTNVPQMEAVAGQGVKATFAEKQVLIGNLALLTERFSVPANVKQDVADLAGSGHSIVLVAVDQKVVALFGIKDELRPTAKATLAQLKKMGARRLIMLSGDDPVTVQQVGEELGLTESHGGMLPEEKAAFVKELQKNGKVAFIGDGINDSPSLALADIGIAMGNGTDVAIETSDIVLMHSNFAKLPHAYGLAKKTTRNMRENILLALATVAFLLVGLVLGYIYMASGMLVHELSILVVIFNGMRLLTYKTKKLDRDQLFSTANELN